MPIYDFECPSCGNSFELRKGWDEPATAVCDLCGANAVKLFATPTIIYKGSGFYSTDYKNSSASVNGRKPSEQPNRKKKAEPAASADGKSSAKQPAPSDKKS